MLSDPRFDDTLFLYHIGDHPDYLPTLQMLLRRPGVVVLHDVALGRLVETAEADGMLPLFAQHDHGAFGQRLAQDRQHSGWRGRFCDAAMALNGVILAHASALIVLDRAVQFKAAARAPGLPVHYLSPHLDAGQAAARVQAILEGSARRLPMSPPVSLTARSRTGARALLRGDLRDLRAHPSLWWRFPLLFGAEPGTQPRILCVDADGHAAQCLERIGGWPAASILALRVEALSEMVGQGMAFDAALLVIDAAAVDAGGRMLVAIARLLRWGAPVVLELVGGSAVAVAQILSALGCSGIKGFAASDVAPELEAGLERRGPLDRHVGMGVRMSPLVIVPRQGGELPGLRHVQPADGTWMTERFL